VTHGNFGCGPGEAEFVGGGPGPQAERGPRGFCGACGSKAQATGLGRMLERWRGTLCFMCVSLPGKGGGEPGGLLKPCGLDGNGADYRRVCRSHGLKKRPKATHTSGGRGVSPIFWGFPQLWTRMGRGGERGAIFSAVSGAGRRPKEGTGFDICSHAPGLLSKGVPPPSGRFSNMAGPVIPQRAYRRGLAMGNVGRKQPGW